MRILYYDWDEFNGKDCRDAMVRLGHQVDTIKVKMEGYDLTPEFEKAFAEKINLYDCVYSFDYFPNISEVCQKYGMPYISWVFDCPHYTLDSHTTSNDVNHIYLFDKRLYNMMCSKNIAETDIDATISSNTQGNSRQSFKYSPLAVNAERLSSLCHDLDAETGGKIVYQHDVCFLGSLYDNEYNFYDQVNYLPPYLKGYVDAVIAAQERVFGADFFTEDAIFSDDHVRQLREYIKFEETGKYEINYDNVIRDILRKKVTVNERHHILEQMGKRFETVLYTTPGARDIPGVCNMGVADYTTKMPKVFHRSKINLNITLRSILSGVPLRVVDILAAGGFLLTNYQEEIAEYFVDGQDLVIAYTPEDMIEKAAYYLEHEDERETIALNGQKKVLENFAYTKLLPRVLSLE
ncbi:glycosyltransferase family protein [Butyrivibrio sp. VCB2006]|uniref:glycosyltransferase family protein n=1 Tax=Butyrivibrio sp. VCB2006 TaxID=1280679 RepID=UPI000408755C|nr:glycosyltransferase [Butyrivibrio sp. VCB2006]